MTIKLAVLLSYAVICFGLGWMARLKWTESPAGYFLANRALGPLIFLASMAATNFSAFTVFGVSGVGYRDGYAFYPIMAFGTGFMALTFWIVGRKARELGLEHGALTPPQLVRACYPGRPIFVLFSLVLIVFTAPYLALQPIAAGYALQELFGLDYIWGAALVTAVIALYTLQGGLRAVAWTDAFQGLLMLGVLILALVMIAARAGGLGPAGRQIFQSFPELFQRPGGGGGYGLNLWFSYIALWFFCDPMFPQLFQRFLAARDDRTIRRTMLAYPLVCAVVFLPPITIGVLGRLLHPGLSGAAADRILPLLAVDLNQPAFAALVVACGLAALMSTMSSQLLTLSSIFSQDLYPLLSKRPVSNAWPGRVFVVVLAAAGFALAVRPFGTMLSIAQQAFTGLAALFPTVLFGLYPSWKSNRGALVSILAGEAAVLASYFKALPTFGFLPVVPVMAIAFFAYLAVSFAETVGKDQRPAWPLAWLKSPYTWAFLLIFGLAHDWWRWGQTPSLIWGWPSWMAYFLLLSGIQTWLMSRWTAETK